MTSKLHVIAIVADPNMTAFMQHLDVFEPWKVLGSPLGLDLTLKPDCTTERAIQDAKILLERAGRRVVAIFAPSEPTAWKYRDDSVRAVSTGTHWNTLDNILAAEGWPKEAV